VSGFVGAHLAAIVRAMPVVDATQQADDGPAGATVDVQRLVGVRDAAIQPRRHHQLLQRQRLQEVRRPPQQQPCGHRAGLGD